jgi:thiamine kinase-like enzyme
MTNMPLSLEEAIARVPGWADAPGLEVASLDGGITNHNYRIDVGGESFVLQIAGQDSMLLGIDRDHAYAAALAAGKLGISPAVYYFIQPEGYLVTRFFAGHPIPPEEITQRENIRLVVDTLRRIHGMSPIPGRFDAFQMVRNYTQVARRYRVRFPGDFDQLTAAAGQVEQALRRSPRALRPCHNDLLNANFLFNGRLAILDWEYAGMGDEFFDLGNFSDHHNLSDDQDRWLLAYYFDGRETAQDWAHFKVMKFASDLREATWGLVQAGISKLDFDFCAYADKFFGRVNAHIQNPKWNEWLKEVNEYV